MDKFLNVAVETVRKAGEKLNFLIKTDFEIKHKGEVDLVTQADLESEKIITESIKKAFPTHGILAEEGTFLESNSKYLWIIDPLDGTTNYTHRFPIYSISIALQYKKEIVLGIVYNPSNNKLFIAVKGKGAFLNNKPIEVSGVNKISDSLLITGFPCYIRENPGKIFEIFKDFSLKAQGVRRCGSAALDLCYVACGRVDGFWEEGLKPWDTAAGSLILKEAGGKITKFDGSRFDIDFPEILGTNGKIHHQMLDIVSL
ncbi:MAG: inositol monophosphatase [Actinomycetia bacterium]|nr:inositol monophosphatase [Actinomycetes bacterium]